MRKLIFPFLLLTTFLCMRYPVQAQKNSSGFTGKEYLSKEGYYLAFVNDKKALFNSDTAFYKWINDSLQLTVTRWVIGEHRYSFTEKYLFRVHRADSGLKLTTLKELNTGSSANSFFLNDISKIKNDLKDFESFTISRKEHITYSGEANTSGVLIRKQTVYKMVEVTLQKNKQLVTTLSRFTVMEADGKTTNQQELISSQKRTLSATEFKKRLGDLKKGYFAFIED